MTNALSVTLTLNNDVSLMVSECSNTHMQVDDIIKALTLEDCQNIIAQSISKSTIQPLTTEDIVKRVIDEFDLHVLRPGIDAPQSEYDSESHRIAKKITRNMSIDRVAHIIKSVFDESFETNINVDTYRVPAEHIHTQLNQLLHAQNQTRCVIIDK